MISGPIRAPSPTFDIPDDVADVLARYFTTEYAYQTPKGEPLCWPVTPYWYPDRKVLAIATGVAYPNKAVYAQANPKISMFFSDSKRSGMEHPPILVQGLATVLDQDVQANTDRYIREIRAKFGLAKLGMNSVSVRLMDFYLPRLWVEMTPVRVVVFDSPIRLFGDSLNAWPSLELGAMTKSTEASQNGLDEGEHHALERVTSECSSPVLTVIGPDGHPWCERRAVMNVESSGELRLTEGEVLIPPGPAVLTFHRNTLLGVRLHAYMVRGRVMRDNTFAFKPSKLVNFFGNGAVFPLSLIPSVPKLRRRLSRELARLGQPAPKLRIPPSLDQTRGKRADKMRD